MNVTMKPLSFNACIQILARADHFVYKIYIHKYIHKYIISLLNNIPYKKGFTPTRKTLLSWRFKY